MTQFGALLQLLDEHRVEFVVIGGVAAAARGSARSTADLDVVYARSDENLARLVRALASHQPYLRGAPKGLPFVWDEKTLRMGLNFTLVTDLGALDLLGEVVGGGRFEDLRSQSSLERVHGSQCHVVKLEKLIELKRAAGRPKDFEAIAELEIILEERDQRR
jgi:hypothetical protein